MKTECRVGMGRDISSVSGDGLHGLCRRRS